MRKLALLIIAAMPSSAVADGTRPCSVAASYPTIPLTRSSACTFADHDVRTLSIKRGTLTISYLPAKQLVGLSYRTADHRQLKACVFAGGIDRADSMTPALQARLGAFPWASDVDHDGTLEIILPDVVVFGHSEDSTQYAQSVSAYHFDGSRLVLERARLQPVYFRRIANAIDDSICAR